MQESAAAPIRALQLARLLSAPSPDEASIQAAAQELLRLDEEVRSLRRVLAIEQTAPTASTRLGRPLSRREVTDLIRSSARGQNGKNDGNTLYRLARAVERAHQIDGEHAQESP